MLLGMDHGSTLTLSSWEQSRVGVTHVLHNQPNYLTKVTEVTCESLRLLVNRAGRIVLFNQAGIGKQRCESVS